MSTRGSVIVRKDHVDKEIYVHYDAYPDHTGRNVVRLIKTLDLTRLYDLLLTLDEYVSLAPEDEDPPCEFDFSPSACEDAVGEGRPYVYEGIRGRFIEDSLFCEYAYVLDLDEDELLFFVGFQTEPQAGNPYGQEPSRTGYYPCRLSAVFPFSYVRQTPTAAVVEHMEEVAHGESREVRTFRVTCPKH
jgi:hypothetical protein